MSGTSGLKEWQRLLQLADRWKTRRVADALRDELARTEHLRAEAAGILLDISRQRLDEEVLDALIALADACGVGSAIDAMWRGDAINHTEKRAALHVALRAEPGDGVGDAASERFVGAQRERMRVLVQAIRAGEWCAPGGARFEHVVHVGIGGSHLGPALAVDVLDAVSPDAPTLDVHFVSTTDPLALARLMRRLPRERTLLTLVSKSFTTAETMLNADTLVDWLAQGTSRDAVLREQVVGISANIDAMHATGIPAAHQLQMPEWAGGRYSLWSAVGLPVALRFGMPSFEQLLTGARAMDRHFHNAKPRENLPLLLALTGIWNINFQDIHAHAALPYTEALARLPAYLQQLEMESNGKCVDREGRAVDYRTAPVVWGGVGMAGQHAYLQQLHQGNIPSALDFILVGGPDAGLRVQRDCALVSGLAQAEALTAGRDIAAMRADHEDENLLPYRAFPGERPSSTLLVDELDARRLGALLALYEHKVFVQSVIWNLNPFDQFGVELGKAFARRLGPLLAVERGSDAEADAATRRLLDRLTRR